MRVYFSLALLIFCIAGTSQAQNNIDLGTIQAPVLDGPVVRDTENEEATSEDTTGNTIAPPQMDLMPTPSAMDFGMKFDSFELPTKYRSLEIIEPANNSTIAIHSNNIIIKTNVVPPVRQDLGHVLQITLDNEVVIENQTDFMLDDADRGAHVIGLRVVDSDGETVQQAESVSIIIR